MMMMTTMMTTKTSVVRDLVFGNAPRCHVLNSFFSETAKGGQLLVLNTVVLGG